MKILILGKDGFIGRNLLKYFGTINAISKAPESELIKVKNITSDVAKNIYNYFNKNV